MKNFRTRFLSSIIFALGVFVSGMFLSCSSSEQVDNSAIETYESFTFDSIKNLDHFYQTDQSRELDFLSEKGTYDKKVKSIQIYRFSTAYDSMQLQQELYFDFNGKLIKSAYFSSDYSVPAYTYYFYNASGNIFLDVSLSHNKYDTTYSLRNYDEKNRITQAISYNIKRDELNTFVTRTYKSPSNSELRIVETDYDNDMTIQGVLPYYVSDIHLTVLSTSEVRCNISRIVCQDTTNNSTWESFYRIENQKIVSEKDKPSYEYKDHEDWIYTKGDGYQLKRVFNFYKDNEAEVKKDFSYSKAVLFELDSMMQVIPATAWKNNTKRNDDISYKSKLYTENKYGKVIERKEAKSIEAFTPVLWYLVSVDSGSIDGLPGMFYAAAYNTPIKDDDGFNKRCLAIYERTRDGYTLQKQSMNALETFNDYEEDFSYHDFNEANFTVDISEGGVSVSYGYMRGEATYLYGFRDDNWVLLAYESNHRTCCEAESTSYDYRTETYSSSVYSSTGEDEKDTTITVHQKRPTVYMDNMNVMQYDYNETGLIAK